MKAQVVSFHCILKNKLGQVLSSTFNNEVITQPGVGNGQILKGLVDGLQNIKKGERRLINVSAEQAYGFYDPGKVIHCRRDEVPRGSSLKIGDQVLMKSDDDGTRLSLRVASMDPEWVTLDGNHPLAGQDLVFEIEATQARDATLEEMPQDAVPSGALGMH